MTAYDDNNIFAKILRGELPAQTIHEDEYALAFHDIQPQTPVHVLVIPKGRYVSFDDFVTKADEKTITGFFRTVQIVAAQLGIDKSGYRLLANHGEDAGQLVPHFHVHLCAGTKMGPLMVSA